MKFIAEIEGEKMQAEVRREGARVFAEIEGRRYELEAREVEPGIYLFVWDGRVCEARFGAGASGASRVEVTYGRGAGSYEVALADPRRLRAKGGAAGAAAGRAQIVAPMPGKVVRVLVEQGDEVEAGQGIVVVEAMKMQNELKSPRQGTVVELRTSVGSTVNAGEMLAIIE